MKKIAILLFLSMFFFQCSKEHVMIDGPIVQSVNIEQDGNILSVNVTSDDGFHWYNWDRVTEMTDKGVSLKDALLLIERTTTENSTYWDVPCKVRVYWEISNIPYCSNIKQFIP